MMVFQKRVVCTKLDIYVFFYYRNLRLFIAMLGIAL
jgi:hypothetical protein